MNVSLAQEHESSRMKQIATAVSSPVAHVEVYRDNAEVETIRPVWESWQNHPNTDIDFYQTILKGRPEILRPHVMLVCNDRGPQAMLIGRIERRRLPMKIGYFRFLQPDVRVLTLPLGGLLGIPSDEHCALLVNEVVSSLRRGEADLAFFEPIQTESALYRCIQSSSRWFSKDYLHKSQIHRSMTVPKSAESFYACLSPKVRKNLRRQAKKLVQDFSGDVRIGCYKSEVMIPDVEAIAQKTYQRGLGVGFSSDPEMRARLKLEADKGWLRGHVLYLANKPCAFWLAVVYQNIFHSAFMGYDPEYASNSPGMFLTTSVIEDLCRESGADRVREIDFGLGDAQYKKVLGTRSCEEIGLYIFAPSLKGCALNLATTLLGSLDRTARKILERTNLLMKVKRIWRKSALKR